MIEQNPTFAELKQSVDRVARKLEYLYRQLNLQYPDEAVPLYVLEAQELVRQGRDSEAVKIIREQTAVGIIEARAIVDDLARRSGRSNDSAAPVPERLPAPTPAFTESLVTSSGSIADQAAVDAAWRDAVRAARDGA